MIRARCHQNVSSRVRCNSPAFVFRYRIIRDPAGWLKVDRATGLIKVKNIMDRESPFVIDDKYTVLVGAYDNGRRGPAHAQPALSCAKCD